MIPQNAILTLDILIFYENIQNVFYPLFFDNYPNGFRFHSDGTPIIINGIYFLGLIDSSGLDSLYVDIVSISFISYLIGSMNGLTGRYVGFNISNILVFHIWFLTLLVLLVFI